MRKLRLLSAGAVFALLTAFFLFLNPFSSAEEAETIEGEEEETENLWDRYQQEFEQLRDPATGVVPAGSLRAANDFTRASQRSGAASRTAGLAWQERGPVYDVVGPSNGNSRAGNEYTAGIVQSFVVDAKDPSGNTIIVGSPSGGLWRCTNFVSTATPNWQPVNDFMANLAIASICQDPSNPNVMYLATGDANTRDVRGYGVWKSTNAGLNWNLLSNTTAFTTSFKILCDNAGNVYLATGGAGLRRSTDGGTTWTSISPLGLTASNASYVTDMELGSTGRLHAVFGYYGSKVQHFYTDAPASVTSSFGWTQSTGLRNSTVACARMEMATLGDVAYAVTCNSSFYTDSCYKSTDGGATWTLQNTTAYPNAITNTQGWYALEVDINPDNPSEIIVGSVDMYRSTNDGVNVSRATYWVGSTPPYVHADHHAVKWYKVGGENRLIIGCDGGMFISRNGGTSFVDRNQNLGIKQFYSCAISPTANENFLFGGTQDNGCHQLKQPGLGFSTETTGGDGAYVHINQQNPQIQFGSYIYNQYRRSTNGGTNWSAANLSGSTGYFINPFDYDDALNILYASNASSSTPNNQIRRWENANTSNTSVSVTISAMVRGSTSGNATALKVSPYTANRLFIGTSRGGLLRLENANTVTTSDADNNVTDITGTGFPVGGYLNCVNTGSSDNVLVATFTNYGVNNVWVSTNGGSTWTAVDGNLPDMPVWWAVFVPGNDNKLLIATETGVFATDALNGGSTVWTAEAGFPLVRTRMLKVRASDNTIVAATYGRGLWTAQFNSCVLSTITTQPSGQTACPGATVTFNVAATGTGLAYQWRKGGTNIAGATGGSFQLTNVSASDAGNYDVVVTNACGNTTSNPATLSVTGATTVNTQPTAQTGCPGGSATFTVAATGSGLTYQWRKAGSNIAGATNASLVLNNLSATDAGTYDVVVSSTCGGSVTSAAAALTLGAGTAIGTQPSSQTVCAGSAVTMNVAATGSGTLTYQWRKGGTNITGANGAAFSIASPTAADAATYDVVITGSCGTVTSSGATLTVNAGTTITQFNSTSSVCAGATVNFSVLATGTGTLTYQWKKGGTNIPGATSSTYNIASAATTDAGTYSVTVTGSCGSTNSTGVDLAVNTGGGCVTAIPNVDPDVSVMTLMPNVVEKSSVLRLKVQRPMNVTWRVVDAQGKTVMSFVQRLTTGQTDMNLQLSRLSAGAYYLHGTTEKGKLGTLRFTKL